MSDFSPAALTLPALRARGEPNLFERDTGVWKARIVAWFEEASGRTLYPDQTEMFLVEMLAYVLAVHGESAQAAVVQNLAVWATGRNLDDVAANLSIFRLLAQKAVTRFRFTLPAAAIGAVLVPRGTLVASAAGVSFVLVADAAIAPGSTFAEAAAIATEAGTAANGFQAGQLTASFASIAAGLTATNVSVSSGGSDEETDDHLRAVAVDAAEGFDRRGGWGGYGLFVRRVNPSITDVAVDRPQPGYIDVVPMVAGDAAPGAALLAQVKAALDPERVTPMGDMVTVRAPVAVDFNVALSLKTDPLLSVAPLVAEVDARVRAAFAKPRRRSPLDAAGQGTGSNGPAKKVVRSLAPICAKSAAEPQLAGQGALILQICTHTEPTRGQCPLSE